MKYNFEIFASAYSTISIGDSAAFGKDLEQYDEQDIDFLLRLNHLGDDLIRIYTISDEDVPFEVDTSPPFSNLSDERWDLISETSLKCPTRILLVKGLLDLLSEAKSVELTSEEVRLRIFYGNMTTESKNDFYKVEIWPASYQDSTLVFRSDNYAAWEI